MKNILYCWLILIGFGCKSDSPKTENKSSKQEQQIVVEIHPNIETVGIILSLSDLGDYIIDNYSTKTKNYLFLKAFRDKFKDFKTHPAVLKANSLAIQNLLHFNHYYYGLYFSPLPNFEQEQPLNELFLRHGSLTSAEAEALLKDWNLSIKDFYKEAKLEDFFTSQKKIYTEIIDETKTTLPQGYVTIMADFFGSGGTDKYIVCPSAAVPHSFNFGPTLTKGDTTISYYITGPAYDLDTNTMPTDSIGFNDKEYIADLAIHEFAHSFVRFINNEKYQPLIDSLNEVIVKEVTNVLGHGRVDMIVLSSAFEEHLVRASEVMILKGLGKQDKVKQKLETDYQEGYILLNEFVKSLENYQKNRDKYPTLESYFTTLVNDVFGVEKMPVKE